MPLPPFEERQIAELKPWPNNARTHSRKQIRQIAESIKTFGFTNPVLIDSKGTILAGHGRVEAAGLLGQTTVPCIQIEHMSEDQKRAYVLADNKLALNAGWDEEILAIELQVLIETPALSIDIGVIGFDPGEIDVIINAPKPTDRDGPPEDDILPPIDENTVVTTSGDLWICGDHKVICGDSLQSSTYETLMGRETAEMAFTDPPYNVPVNGHVSGLGKVRHREFAMASGEMSSPQFIQFLSTAFARMAEWSTNGSIHFVCMDWRHMSEILTAGEERYTELKNLIVWAKDNGGMGSFYRSRHELIFAFKNGTAPHINTFELGQTGRYRTNVWQYRGINSGGAEREEALALHPTVKPAAMIADAIRDCSRRGNIVLDAFGGSGSTLIAAERTRRRARLIELDPLYVDRTIRRWQSVAHDDAIHAATGRTFENIAAERLADEGDDETVNCVPIADGVPS